MSISSKGARESSSRGRINKKRWPSGVGSAAVQIAKLLGAKRCLATASGTTALIVGMHVLDVDAGDELRVRLGAPPAPLGEVAELVKA